MTIFGISLGEILLGAALFVGSFVVFNLVLILVVIAIPADYFSRERKRNADIGWRKILRRAEMIGKNILGVLMFLAGVLLILPGIPGPGFLLILLGISFVDFPGKRRLEQKLLGKPSVLKTINSLRHRFRRPPLIVKKPEE